MRSYYFLLQQQRPISAWEANLSEFNRDNWGFSGLHTTIQNGYMDEDSWQNSWKQVNDLTREQNTEDASNTQF